jgi:AAA domain, putative AbiEii toxin, Type IV TA system
MRLPFSGPSGPRMWTVLVGENGLCKTSILQAVALAAIGADSANFFQEIIPALPDRRKKQAAVQIDAAFEFGTRCKDRRTYPGLNGSRVKPIGLRSSVTIQSGWSLFQGDSEYLTSSNENSLETNRRRRTAQGPDPLKEARGKGLPFWFVAGYGTARSLPLPLSTESISSPALERLASLFDRGRIVGTGFADLLKEKLVKSYARVLQHALLDHAGILTRIDRLELRGKGGVKSAKHLVESHRFEFRSGDEIVRVPATWLSQGYQATISWLADVVGQMFWDAQAEVDLSEMEGLVLIDELDLHLHPLWQVGLVRALKATFPRIQFVVTTHSPMLLPGLEKDEIIHLKLNEAGNVTYELMGESPALLSASQIYQTFFGIDRLFPSDSGEALYRYGYIATNPNRTDEEEAEMMRLQQQLRRIGQEPGLQPVDRP